MIGPNFIVVGAARSGTTALHHWLGQHPEIFVSPIKETNYFAKEHVRFCGPLDPESLRLPVVYNPDGAYEKRRAAIVKDKKTYFSLFKQGAAFKARGETSPSYLYYRDTVQKIFKIIPACKIIILLREPVARTISNYNALRGGREKLSFRKALDKENERISAGWDHIWAYKGLSLYYEQVKQYLDVFPKEQVGIWLYRDLKMNAKVVYSEICKFLGVDSTFVPNFTRDNESHNIYTPLLLQKTAKFLPLELVVRLRPFVHRNFSKSIIIKTEKNQLKEFFRDDVLALDMLLPKMNLLEKWNYPLSKQNN